jgi:nucleoid-associated protein YgaU
MQRDVKVGLVFGILLVAGAAVLFFRREGEDREKFAKLLPGPDVVADKAKKALGASPSDPYPVHPEFLADTWQSARLTPAARAPSPPRENPRATDRTVPPAQTGDCESKTPGAAPVVLHPPEYSAPNPAPRPKPEPVTSLRRQPAPTAAAPAAGPHEFTIREYDTLSDIAAQKLGDAGLWPQLYEANRAVLPDPNHLPVGQKIRLPELRRAEQRVAPTNTAPPTQLARSGRNQANKRVYEVQENDTLIKIARHFYQDSAMFREIYEANRDQLQSPDDLRAGMVLRLP